jgi:outer membrane protein insertion porin family
MQKIFFFLLILIIPLFPASAQIAIGGDDFDINYELPIEYEIGGITISGVEHLDRNVLILLSGLSVGEKIKIPGERISKAIENLWDQGLFADVQIYATKKQGNIIFLEIYLEERPRLSKFSFLGVRENRS